MRSYIQFPVFLAYVAVSYAYLDDARELTSNLYSEGNFMDELRHAMSNILNFGPIGSDGQMYTSSPGELEALGLKSDAALSVASCQSFPSSTNYYSTCANAVDYSFYVPANVALTYLEKTARSALNSTTLSILPATCQAALKKLICANVYLKCYPGATPTDSTKTGWNTQIYSDTTTSYAVAFERPCVSVCSGANTNCLGILSLLGLSQTCTSTFDYSYGEVTSVTPFKYDQANAVAYCNAMSTSSFTVGSSKETYVGTVCKGIVDNLFVVPASKVSTLLAPMQAPYVVQNLIEAQLAAYAKQVTFVETDCHYALLKYFCRSAMPQVTSTTFGAILKTGKPVAVSLATLAAKVGSATATAIYNAAVYLPSFPAYSVCENYEETCSEFIALADRAQLTPNCTSTTTFGSKVVRQYPTANQTIATLSSSTFGTTLTFTVTSSPDYLSSATDSTGYTVACPQGFVVPDDPNDSRVTWVPGTGCAVACRVPVLTNEEFNYMDRSMYILGVIAIGLTFIVFVIYITDEQKRREEETVIIFAFFAFFNAISFTLLRTVPDAKTCSNNAVGINHEDGASICSVTAFINMYCIFACTVSWMCHSVDKFFKLVLGLKPEALRIVNYTLILVYPWICVVGAGTLNLWGYSNGPKLCVFSGNNPHDFNVIAVFIIPLCVIVGVAAALKLVVIFVLITNKRKDVSIRMQKSDYNVLSNSKSEVVVSDVTGEGQPDSNESKGVAESTTTTSKRPDEKGLHAENGILEYVYDINDMSYDHNIFDLITSVLFNQLFFYLWVVSLVYRIMNYRRYYAQKDSFFDWAECAFANFDGTTQSWMSVCGEHPSYRLPYGLQLTYFLFVTGQGTLFGAIFLSNPYLWYSLYMKLFGKGSEKKADDADGYMMVPIKSHEKSFRRRDTAPVLYGNHNVFPEDDETPSVPNYMDNSSFHGNGQSAPVNDEEENSVVAAEVGEEEAV